MPTLYHSHRHLTQVRSVSLLLEVGVERLGGQPWGPGCQAGPRLAQCWASRVSRGDQAAGSRSWWAGRRGLRVRLRDGPVRAASVDPEPPPPRDRSQQRALSEPASVGFCCKPGPEQN